VLFALAAVAIVASVSVIGVVLIAAYIVIPAATARLLSRSLFRMTVLSITIGLFSTVVGLIGSYLLDVPSGSTIILTQAALFLLAAALPR